MWKRQLVAGDLEGVGRAHVRKLKKKRRVMGCELSRQLREPCCGLSMLSCCVHELSAVMGLVEATVALREGRKTRRGRSRPRSSRSRQRNMQPQTFPCSIADTPNTCNSIGPTNSYIFTARETAEVAACIPTLLLVALDGCVLIRNDAPHVMRSRPGVLELT